MSKFISAVRSFMADEEGVTALEYGMIAALIAGAIVLTVESVGDAVKTAFTNIADAMAAPAP